MFWYEGSYNLLHIGERYPSLMHSVFDSHVHPVDVFFLRIIIRHSFTINVDKYLLVYSIAADVDCLSILGLPKVYGYRFFSVREWDTLITIKPVFIRGGEIVDKTIYFVFRIC